MTLSQTLSLALCAGCLAGCGMKTSLLNNGSYAILGGGGSSSSSGGGSTSSSSSGGSGSSSGGSGVQLPTISEIAVNLTLSWVFTATAPTTLNLTSGSVLNAATYTSPAPSGGLAVLIASNLPVTVPASNGQFPTTLGGLSLTVDGKAAGLCLVAPNQITFQVPAGLAAGTYPVVVTSGTTTVTTTTATIAMVAPGLISAAMSSTGAAAGETITYNSANADWEGPVIFAKDPSTLAYYPMPVGTGSWLVLYGTGWANATNGYMTVGGTTVLPNYAGPSISVPGLDEIVYLVPSTLAGLTTNTFNVSVTAQGTTSNTVRLCIAGTNGGACPD